MQDTDSSLQEGSWNRKEGRKDGWLEGMKEEDIWCAIILVPVSKCFACRGTKKNEIGFVVLMVLSTFWNICIVFNVHENRDFQDRWVEASCIIEFNHKINFKKYYWEKLDNRNNHFISLLTVSWKLPFPYYKKRIKFRIKDCYI